MIKVPNRVILDNLYVNIVLGRELFEKILIRYGKEGWNEYVRKLRQHDVWAMYSTPEPTEDDEHCMPVCLEIDMSKQSFREHDLSDLDLFVPDMKDCDFTRADLSRCTLGTVDGSTFKDANLAGASFKCSISGCDFSGADLSGAVFDHPGYHSDNPPLSLPPDILGQCRPYPEHWSNTDISAEDKTIEPLTARSVDLRSFWGAPALNMDGRYFQESTDTTTRVH